MKFVLNIKFQLWFIQAIHSPIIKVRFAHPLNIDEIAVENPELTIIMCHLGNPWILDCQEILYKNQNVYADISGLVIEILNYMIKCITFTR